MVKSVLTRVGREKLCKAHAGDISLPPITQIAFGDGGVDSDGNVISVTGEEVSLRNELMRKDIDEHYFQKGQPDVTVLDWINWIWQSNI